MKMAIHIGANPSPSFGLSAAALAFQLIGSHFPPPPPPPLPSSLLRVYVVTRSYPGSWRFCQASDSVSAATVNGRAGGGTTNDVVGKPLDFSREKIYIFFGLRIGKELDRSNRFIDIFPSVYMTETEPKIITVEPGCFIANYTLSSIRLPWRKQTKTNRSHHWATTPAPSLVPPRAPTFHQPTRIHPYTSCHVSNPRTVLPFTCSNLQIRHLVFGRI